ncbi:hypothetical protein N7456_006067 [Penicillium angulare]|uniref:Aminoglycoside phosphotransferase domain-containing protein n=1 Tax=Penicillium angulare TaxID=116970 RepID=A0A9W9FZQ0_9EURO|nr:hypothetical protein N7456_006067 [Penicillium angulare]
MKAPNLFVEEEHPVLYSEWVSGKPLAVWNNQVSLVKRQRILTDLAEFLLQIWTVHVPPDFATEKSRPYSVWLTESLDRGLRRTLSGTARWGNAIDYLIMRSMIPDYAADLDKYSGFGFTHGDLHAHNIMRSDDFHLTGVIDWDWMSVAPLPAIIHHPWFIADIPGWNNQGVAEDIAKEHAAETAKEAEGEAADTETLKPDHEKVQIPKVRPDNLNSQKLSVKLAQLST